ncbi:hypothetical protein GGR32_001285 [Mesonia hippocampi]|uniref:N-acetyltransferase domain-containing protein n=1 Tax=Mesonia hippocampi TaxID=1628250 RepID=A0A840EY63_9FLAO|nr:GNAT family N-acetyltransferase [Mesonia hippocampi]MBB4118994.1 hypothetical protein [Mesonia hippocampi]
MKYPIKHKESNTGGIFFISQDNHVITELTYKKREPNIMVIDHTQTKKDLQGKGLASYLLDHVVNYAKENKLKIDPLCPFVEIKFEEIEAYQSLKV